MGHSQGMEVLGRLVELEGFPSIAPMEHIRMLSYEGRRARSDSSNYAQFTDKLTTAQPLHRGYDGRTELCSEHAILCQRLYQTWMQARLCRCAGRYFPQ